MQTATLRITQRMLWKGKQNILAKVRRQVHDVVMYGDGVLTFKGQPQAPVRKVEFEWEFLETTGAFAR